MTSDAALQARVAAAFAQRFGGEATDGFYAPGRVNLIGEHTDYNDGFVMPAAIDCGTLILARATQTGRVNVVAADYDNAQDSFELGHTIPERNDAPWTAHVRGIVQVLQAQGHALIGLDMAIGGNVPQGAGLSSSASLGVCVALTLREMTGLSGINATDLALVAQRSENEFVGANCGIMDQLVSARAAAGSALMIDCRSLHATPVLLPENAAMMIVHSGVHRQVAESAYNERRAQCEAVASAFGVRALRDVSLDALDARKASLDEVAYRRARHVITDNDRTQAALAAMRSGALAHMGALMRASHVSMRDDFEISVPAMDALVDILNHAIGDEGGARLTGAGFGGCVVALLPKARAGEVRAIVEAQYRTPDGRVPLILQPVPSAGARRVF